MENSKIITVNDLGNEIKLRIKLFDAEKGLDFVDNLGAIVRSKEFSIKPFLDDLLPLASLMDANGDKVVMESLTRKDCYGLFRNPLSILELGTQIFEFQTVFLTDSELFRPLAEQLQGILHMKNLGSETK